MNNSLLNCHKFNDTCIIEWHPGHTRKILSWLPSMLFDEFISDQIGFTILSPNTSKPETLWVQSSLYHSGFIAYIEDMYCITGIVLKNMTDVNFNYVYEQVDKRVMWEILRG